MGRPTESFRIGIRPKLGVVYRYRQVMRATMEMGGNTAPPMTRDIVQRLKLVKANEQGSQILLDTESVKLQLSSAVPPDPKGIAEAETEMRAALKIGITLDLKGNLESFVSYTKEPAAKLWQEMTSVCFAFVVSDLAGKVVKAGDAWYQPVDPAAFVPALQTTGFAIKPEKPLRSLWAVKSMERRNGRQVAILSSSLSGDLDFTSTTKEPLPFDTMHLTTSGTLVYDVASGMLIESETSVVTRGKVSFDKSGGNKQTTVDRTKSKVTLLNPGIL